MSDKWIRQMWITKSDIPWLQKPTLNNDFFSSSIKAPSEWQKACNNASLQHFRAVLLIFSRFLTSARCHQPITAESKMRCPPGYSKSTPRSSNKIMFTVTVKAGRGCFTSDFQQPKETKRHACSYGRLPTILATLPENSCTTSKCDYTITVRLITWNTIESYIITAQYALRLLGALAKASASLWTTNQSS